MDIVNKPVQVVTELDKAGLVKPVCFYMMNEQEMGEVHNINRLIRRDKERIGGNPVITFTCEIISNNMKALCDLRLNLDTEEWILYRI